MRRDGTDVKMCACPRCEAEVPTNFPSCDICGFRFVSPEDEPGDLEELEDLEDLG